MNRTIKLMALCTFLAVPSNLLASPMYEYNSKSNTLYKYTDGDRSKVTAINLDTGDYAAQDWGALKTARAPDADYILVTEFAPDDNRSGTVYVFEESFDDGYSIAQISETEFGPIPYAYAVVPQSGRFFVIAGLMASGWRFYDLHTGAYLGWFGGGGMSSGFQVLESLDAVAVTCEDYIQIQRVSDGSVIRTFNIGGGLRITANAGETYLAFDTRDSSYRPIIKIYEVQTGKEVATLSTPKFDGYGTGILFADETHLLVTQSDGIHCYDVRTQKQSFVLPLTLTGETGNTYLFVARDGNIITCTGNEICTWDAKTGMMRSCRVIEQE